MIEISVIIPAFNRCGLLPRAIESVLRQQGAVFEIIVVDDGSTDGTAEMLERSFPQITCIRQSRQGPAAARNRGLEAASGEWIAFLDSDDEWLDGKLLAQMEFFRQNPAYPLCQTEEIWIRNGRRVNPMKKHKKSGGQIFEQCLPLCIISPSAVMMHRDLFAQVGLFDETLPACEDYDLWLRVTARFPAGLIEKPYVIKYGGHADQRSREFPAMDRFRIRSLVNIIRSGALSAQQEKAARRMLETKAGIYLAGALKRNKTAEAREIRELLQTIAATA